MVILGGMGNIPGVMLGATVVTVLNLQVLKGCSLWLNELTNAGVTILGSAWPICRPSSSREVRADGVRHRSSVLMMIFRPQGILPARRRQRELAAAETRSELRVGAT